MEEVWKPITELNHYNQMTARYEASNLGRIRNKRTKKNIKPHHHNSGYYSFQYRYKDDKGNVHFSCMLWHRVIATVWLPNPNNLPQIDHIDHDVSNNAISNLRWVTALENAQNTRAKSKIRYSRTRPARVVDKDGNVVAEYPTLEEASKVYGVPIAHALEMLRGRRRPKSWGTFQQDIV